ncbi:zinc finger MYND domain-containing protein 10 [Periophthalmus magnuspinnatus]|uniref:zinc finger MYND domain-containing protein 10 n=1 Tax=Periophthalmus magnuspinnatus TaxID=409849 RepID=UPI002436AD5A|nr:zinc finger MYND domain-containing protein 10 [Periophthalmus magnuspinnatus]
MDTSVILPVEAEGFIQSLTTFSLKDVGSAGWFKQHEYIEKLNMQAIVSATAMHDEFVKELLVSLRKIPVLVHEMILIEVWKHKVFPILCQLQDFKPQNTFQLYIVIRHEATIINLLETIMFHKDSCEAADDSVLDLVDYCHRKLTLLVSKVTREGDAMHEQLSNVNTVDASSLEELQNQNVALELDISLKALSVLRYITDHTDSISVINRLLCTHNIPCVLVQLINCCPWSRCKAGQVEKYMNGKWQKVPDEDRLKITKLDAQAWIALYNLLLNENCQQKYDFNNYNKNQLLKLRSFLTEVVIDQLPALVDLHRFLAHLAVTDPAPPKKGLILEQIPFMWNHIVTENKGKYKAIAKYQVKETFNPSDSDLRQQAQSLAQTYNLEVMEHLLPEKPKCGSCGREATKRCSRCQGEWYCNRECQVKHWPKHKKSCQLIVESTEKIQKDLLKDWTN